MQSCFHVQLLTEILMSFLTVHEKITIFLLHFYLSDYLYLSHIAGLPGTKWFTVAVYVCQSKEVAGYFAYTIQIMFTDCFFIFIQFVCRFPCKPNLEEPCPRRPQLRLCLKLDNANVANNQELFYQNICIKDTIDFMFFTRCLLCLLQ